MAKDMLRLLPFAAVASSYNVASFKHDLVAGVTLAAYGLPISLAYATLAGLPPQYGVYGYVFGGLGYAAFASSKQLAVGPTSAISLMVASSLGALAGGDAERYIQMASLLAAAVGLMCFVAWALHLSTL